jgi:hypothetical protein
VRDRFLGEVLNKSKSQPHSWTCWYCLSFNYPHVMSAIHLITLLRAVNYWPRYRRTLKSFFNFKV